MPKMTRLLKVHVANDTLNSVPSEVQIAEIMTSSRGLSATQIPSMAGG